MRATEAAGRTVEEAIAEALRRLGVDRANVEIEVLSVGGRGLLGLFGSRDARVRATVKQSKVDFGRRFIEEVARALGVGVRVDVEEDEERVQLNVRGQELGLMIGRYGQTMNAMQYLMNIASGKVSSDRRPLVLDIEGYRERRRDSIENMAHRAAERVARYGRETSLEPMSAGERKLVHIALKDDPRVKTQSVGREPFRKVVVMPGEGLVRRRVGRSGRR